MLEAEGYPPVYLAGFLKANQDVYYQTLGQVQLRGEWKEWVQFLATGVDVACRESVEIAGELTAMLARWKAAVTGLRVRSDAAVNRLPDFLIGTPVVTVKQVAEKLGVAFANAAKALGQLQDLGVVEPVREEQKRNRIFVAREVIELLNRPTEARRYIGS